MAQQLSTLTALVEDPGSVPSTHIAGSICGFSAFLWLLWVLHTCSPHSCMQAVEHTKLKTKTKSTCFRNWVNVDFKQKEVKETLMLHTIISVQTTSVISHLSFCLSIINQESGPQAYRLLYIFSVQAPSSLLACIKLTKN